MATMKDVADLAGVSRSTVSIVINGLQQERKIPEETCQRVYDAMRKLNYQTNIMAKRLRGDCKNTPLIALFWPDGFRNNYISRYIQGFQAYMRRQHFMCELVVRFFYEGNLQDEFRDILRGNYSAVIFAATTLADIDFLEHATLNIPVVLLNRQSSVYNTLSVNYESMAELCITHLISKNIQEIAVFTVDDVHLSSSIRTKNILSSARQHGISIAPENILVAQSSEIESSIPVAQEYLARGNFPRAIYCDNDYLAIAFMYACTRAGIRIPQDIEVISIGMLPQDFTAYYTPSLTTVVMPMEDMAAESLKIISNAIEKNLRSPEHRVFQGKLICRESSPACVAASG